MDRWLPGIDLESGVSRDNRPTEALDRSELRKQFSIKRLNEMRFIRE